MLPRRPIRDQGRPTRRLSVRLYTRYRPLSFSLYEKAGFARRTSGNDPSIFRIRGRRIPAIALCDRARRIAATRQRGERRRDAKVTRCRMKVTGIGTEWNGIPPPSISASPAVADSERGGSSRGERLLQAARAFGNTIYFRRRYVFYGTRGNIDVTLPPPL